MATWRAKHDILWTSGPVQARRYRKRIVARTIVHGRQRVALNDGFSLLASYLLGRNETGKVMDMVVPLLQQRVGGTADPEWSVFLIMPEEQERAGLPQPLGGRVELLEAPEATFATFRFTFSATARKLARKERALRSALAAKGLMPVGEAIYVFYSSPLVPLFMRRNEVWLELAADRESAV